MKLGSIFHPSDFSQASEIAFEHALRIALATQARLNMLHVTPEHGANGGFPRVRPTLARWHFLPEGSPAHAPLDLGVEIRKAVASSEDPVNACLNFLERHPAELIVLAVHQYEGRMRWVKERVGEPMARAAGEMTLFIPYDVPGFVSHESGAVSLRNILVPVATRPRGDPALEAAALMVQSFGLSEGTFHVMHVGKPTHVPRFDFEPPEGWRVERSVREGDPDDVILQTAASISADMIVMITEGPNGFLDALRGSTSERVLRGTRCPVVNLPASQWFSRVRRFWTG